MKECRKKELIDYHLQQAQMLVSRLEKEDKNDVMIMFPGGLLGTTKTYHVNNVIGMVRGKVKAQGVVVMDD